MSRILSQRLASGVGAGAGDVRRIEQWTTAFSKIVRKAWSVDKRLAPTERSTNEMRDSGAITDSRSRHQRISFLPGLQTSLAACADTTDPTFGPETTLRSDSRAGEILQVVRFAWTTLYWNVAVVLCGAYVRATGSGAGCGDRWPLCDGEIVGSSANSQSIVEFTHRIT